jgi:hypothetical protein
MSNITDVPLPLTQLPCYEILTISYELTPKAPDPEANKSKQHTLIIKDNFFNPAPTS